MGRTPFLLGAFFHFAVTSNHSHCTLFPLLRQRVLTRSHRPASIRMGGELFPFCSVGHMTRRPWKDVMAGALNNWISMIRFSVQFDRPAAWNWTSLCGLPGHEIQEISLRQNSFPFHQHIDSSVLHLSRPNCKPSAYSQFPYERMIRPVRNLHHSLYIFPRLRDPSSHGSIEWHGEGHHRLCRQCVIFRKSVIDQI
jgi:hypothetical protein